MTTLSSDNMKFEFANAHEILMGALASYLPADSISLADYTEKHRFLNNSGGGYVGRWSHDEAPYLIEPMNALDGGQLATVVVGPGRCGKTTIGQNWLLKSVSIDPADFLVYAQTDKVLQSYVKSEIEPMIDLHSEMRGRLGKRPKDQSISFKKFIGMWAQFLTATYNNLINKSAPRIIITELDACNLLTGLDTYGLATIRRQTFGRESMILAESHPDAAGGLDPKYWNNGIMRLYRDSDRRIWWWPCPECGGFSSPTPGAPRETTLHFDATAPLSEIATNTHLLCPCCGTLIEDKWRKTMNKDGFWSSISQTVSEDGTITGEPIKSDIAGFWITGLMSPFMIGGIGSLARDLASARLQFDQVGDDTSLRDVTVKKWGIPYTPPHSLHSVDAEALSLREEPSLILNRIPEGVRFLTAAADVQANRFELLIRGWGIDGESWIIAYKQISASPATDQSAWDRLISDVMDNGIPLSDSSGRVMHVLAFGYDSGGEEGVTAQAYIAWRRARLRKQSKFLGQLEGRAVYTVLPLKGGSSTSAPLLSVRFPDSQRPTTKGIAANDVPVGYFNPNLFKDRASSDLLINEHGPRYIHFPAGLGQLHDFYDQVAAEERTSSGRWHKRRGSQRNEGWDLIVMSDVMAHLLNIHRINWETPPAWASGWDTNPCVLSPDKAASILPVKQQQAKSTQTPSTKQAVSDEQARSDRLKKIRDQAAALQQQPNQFRRFS